VQKTIQILNRILLLIVILIPAIVFQLASQTSFVSNIIHIVQNYLLLYLIALTVLKSLSIIYPPMPGVFLTIASIPLIGWEKAYIADIIGSGIGATVSYFLGKKYGYSLLNHILGKVISKKISNIKLKQKNQIEAAVFLRFATGGLNCCVNFFRFLDFSYNCRDNCLVYNLQI